MDLAASCKDKLAFFRIKELKDILTELGLSKQGKKQDLVDRILVILSDDRASGTWAKKNAIGKEHVAKLVDDTYRKMQGSGAADVAPKMQGVSDRAKPNFKEPEQSVKVDKIRCVCGCSLPTDTMIKCEDKKCNVWQHVKCVLIPEKPSEGTPARHPEIFYCEICRLSRADPFWVAVAHPLHPVKLNITNIPTDGSNPVQSIEKTFPLTRADKDMLAKQEYDVQAWCMLLNDKQTFRMHWPLHTDLQVNGLPVRAINRPGSQLLGANGRDDGPIITPCIKDGINKITLTGSDARIFCLGVRIVKRRTLQQVLDMIPKETEGEQFQDALARVRRCVGGGAATENADSDSDIEVVADFITVNLRCPMSGSRMKKAGRFKPCAHMGCFDLEVFVEMNQRSRKWQCPICLKNYSIEMIIIDPYFNLITSKLRNCEDVAEIEVKPDGSWRAKPEGDRRVLGELGLWHLPDGTICPSSEAESQPKPQLVPVKQEAGSDSHGRLKLGIKKGSNGGWEFNKFNDMRGILSANGLNGHTIPMSSSATGSGRDFGDVSINQDGNGIMDYSAVHGTEYESNILNFDQANGYTSQILSAPAGNNEIIVLSDSDEEIEPQMSSGAILHQEQQNGISHSFYENPAFGNVTNGRTSSIGLYVQNDDFGINMWSSLPPTSQGGGGFQFFGTDTNEPLNCSTSVNGLALDNDAVAGATGLPSASCSNVNNGLVDNPLAFNGEDPALQIFLPTRPSDTSVSRSDLRERLDDTEDWISLRLGDGGGRAFQGGNVAASNGLKLGKDVQQKDTALDSSADTASLLLGMNGNNNSNRNDNGKTSRESLDSPFTFPRQRRSVRPRLFLSIETDSE